MQIKETGQNNSIMTFYELTEGGDMAATTGEAAVARRSSNIADPSFALQNSTFSLNLYYGAHSTC